MNDSDNTIERVNRARLTALLEPGAKRLAEGKYANDLADKLDPLPYRQRVEWFREQGSGFHIPGDPTYPAQLLDLRYPPIGLWSRGNAYLLHHIGVLRSVAIIGARAASSYGEHVTQELVTGLTRPVISGAAYGIDGAAHRAALYAGIQTVAVSAGGLDRPYPAGHADLFSRIEQGNVVVSEVPDGGTPTRHRFLARNRLIAAMSTASVVVEAGVRSGSLAKIRSAHDLGRPIGAVPGPITSATSAGCHRVIQELGARVITSAEDIENMLNKGDSQ